MKEGYTMKKRIVILIWLLMILCLTLIGCGQRDNNAGAKGDPAETSENTTNNNTDNPSGDAIQNVDGTAARDSDYKNPPIKDGKYVFMVDGYMVTLKTDIWDYIHDEDGKQVFDALRMAEDLGWEWAYIDNSSEATQALSIEWKRIFRPKEYDGEFHASDPSGTPYLELWAMDKDVDQIDTGAENITFKRFDLHGDGSETYYVNSPDGVTVNVEIIILTCYMLENITADNYDVIDISYVNR